MLGSNRVVMRDSGASVDKRLLRRPLHAEILLHFTSCLLLETESEVHAGTALIGVADVASSPRTRSAFKDTGAKHSHRPLIKGKNVTPHRRRLAYIGGDIMVEQKVANIRKVIFCSLKRLPRGCSGTDRTKFPVDGIHLAQHASNTRLLALKSSQHQAGSGQCETFGAEIVLEYAARNFRKTRCRWPERQ